jgi:hypothetical protein
VLARKEQFEEDSPEESRPSDTAQRREQKNDGRNEDAEVMQKITRSSEPAEEGRNGEAVHGGEAMGAAMRMGVGGVSDVQAADVQVRETSDDRDEAEGETDGETDEIEGVHVIWCSVWRLF